MRRYCTEIEIPPDRLIILRLPPALPPGRAVVTVQLRDPQEERSLLDEPGEPGIEWWEEFGGDPEAEDPRALGIRLAVWES